MIRNEKDPFERYEFTKSWALELLTGETLVSSEWVVTGDDGALKKFTETFDSTSATVWVEGGTLGVTYRVQNRVTTNLSPAHKYAESVEIRVTAK